MQSTYSIPPQNNPNATTAMYYSPNTVSTQPVMTYSQPIVSHTQVALVDMPPHAQQNPMMHMSSATVSLPVTQEQYFARHIRLQENSQTFKLVVEKEGILSSFFGVILLILFFPLYMCMGGLGGSSEGCLLAIIIVLIYWIVAIPIILLVAPLVLIYILFTETSTLISMDDAKREMLIQFRKRYFASSGEEAVLTCCQIPYMEIGKVFLSKKAGKHKVMLETKHGQLFEFSLGMNEEYAKEELNYLVKFFQARGVVVDFNHGTPQMKP
ncbi:hypothetical protein FDP41_006408 [Naegleria fowleri]|uniref:Uncharacterized protein n=1 Tax=Naegleria fowleri TaxID=5763 RepID=A0A6A5BI02_NAEFO|nr:uncharacterized protein FDP41_006408 [Naegleria fowleri]KAF0974376.1 hypothetical protein FDP41_006408 [Naegleria fowleri]